MVICNGSSPRNCRYRLLAVWKMLDNPSLVDRKGVASLGQHQLKGPQKGSPVNLNWFSGGGPARRVSNRHCMEPVLGAIEDMNLEPPVGICLSSCCRYLPEPSRIESEQESSC